MGKILDDYLYHIALEIAVKAHKGQVDKGGRPYIEHPVAVAQMVEDDSAKVVALLHDVVEDTNITIEEIDNMFPKYITEAVRILTKPENVPYFEYLRIVKSNPLAVMVKIADLTHNMDLSRIKNPIPKDYQRVKKYKQALEYLRS